jgi:hypothetical protein
MTHPIGDDRPASLEPVHTGQQDSQHEPWTFRLVLFLRVMAAFSLLEGLYHWAVVIGLDGSGSDGFEVQSVSFQTATVFFAVIDLVAAVGLWLAAPWGAVIWLTSIISMAAVEALFPKVYGGSVVVIVFKLALLAVYLALAMMSAREQAS